MDSKDHAKRGSKSPKVTPSADVSARYSTHSTRPSQARSAKGSTGQGTMSISGPPPSPQDAQMDKKFKLFMIGSIVMDVLNFIVTVVAAALYYAAVNRRKLLYDGKYEKEIEEEDIAKGTVYKKNGDKLEKVGERGYGAINSAKAGMPIACILAVVCAACIIIDAFCCVVIKSLRDPKGPKALLGWLVGTAIFILFTMIQVIILIAILTQNPYYILAGDYKELREEFREYKKNGGKDESEDFYRSKYDILEYSGCYPAIIIGFFVLIGRGYLIKPIFAMKNALRGAADGPVFVPPEMPRPSATPSKTGTGATSPTGTATSQNTGSPA